MREVAEIIGGIVLVAIFIFGVLQLTSKVKIVDENEPAEKSRRD